MPQLRTELIKDDFSSLPYINSVEVEEQSIEDTVTVFESTVSEQPDEQPPVIGKPELEIGSEEQEDESDESSADSLTVLYVSLSESSQESIQTVQSMISSLLSSYCYQFAEYTSPAVISKHLEDENELCVFIVPL